MRKNILFLSALTSILIFAQTVNAQWQQIGHFYGSIDCFASNGSTILIGGGDLGGKIFSSSNNGSNWTDINNGIYMPPVDWLCISGTNILAGTEGGLYISKDSGSSWNNVATNAPVEAFAVNGSNIFVGSRVGVYYSSDNGSSWTDANNGLKSYGYQVISLAIKGTNIFAGTEGGVYYSPINGNITWTKVSDGLGKDTLGMSLVVSGSNILSNGYDTSFQISARQVFLSTNDGSNWTKTSLTGISSLTSLGSAILAGSNNGFFISNNNGNNWSNIDLGLPTSITALSVIGTTLYAATWNSNDSSKVWKRPLSDILAVENISRQDDFNIYPNPNNGTFEVQFSNLQNQIELQVFNYSGQKVFSQSSIDTKQTLPLELSNLPEGIYFAQVISSEGVQTKKFIIAK